MEVDVLNNIGGDVMNGIDTLRRLQAENQGQREIAQETATQAHREFKNQRRDMGERYKL
jgi:hypothetical protein